MSPLRHLLTRLAPVAVALFAGLEITRRTITDWEELMRLMRFQAGTTPRFLGWIRPVAERVSPEAVPEELEEAQAEPEEAMVRSLKVVETVDVRQTTGRTTTLRLVAAVAKSEVRGLKSCAEFAVNLDLSTVSVSGAPGLQISLSETEVEMRADRCRPQEDSCSM